MYNISVIGLYMSDTTIIQLKKSSGATLPTESDLEYGEVAVNYGAGHEAISFKNTDNQIISLKEETELSGATTGTGNVVTGISVTGHQITEERGQVDGLPSVSVADNGKILMVSGGNWTVVTPASIYTGTGTPSNTQGTNGDLYLQTE